MRLPRCILIVPLVAGIYSTSGCDGAPNADVVSNAGNGLVSAPSIGPTVRLYSGQDATGEMVSIDQDQEGNINLTFSALVTPVSGTPYTISDSFLWAGLNGTGVFFLTTQSLSFPDPANSALIDRNDCSGSLQVNTDGTFSLTLTVTGFRTPPAGSAPAATTTTVIYSGSSIAVRA
jgi:hypothetical protein